MKVNFILSRITGIDNLVGPFSEHYGNNVFVFLGQDFSKNMTIIESKSRHFLTERREFQVLARQF